MQSITELLNKARCSDVHAKVAVFTRVHNDQRRQALHKLIRRNGSGVSVHLVEG